MPGRVIEVLTAGTMLVKERGFLVIQPPESSETRIPLADIATVIAGQGVRFSAHAVLALQEHGASLILTGPTYHPASFFWPMSDHTRHCQRLKLQIEAGQPLQKRLWQQVIQAKIRQQGYSIAILTGKDEGLPALAKRVRSGDPDNLEAQAARRYWQPLMGKTFRRNAQTGEADLPNILLNYGYAVIRAAMARAVSGSGLHPALGIFHKNQLNTFALVDDLMEPYRPVVDVEVVQILQETPTATKLIPAHKKRLAGLLDVQVVNAQGDVSPLSVTMGYVTQSFCLSLEEQRPVLAYPPNLTERRLL